jgi:hypothetical protein
VACDRRTTDHDSSHVGADQVENLMRMDDMCSELVRDYPALRIANYLQGALTNTVATNYPL